MRTSEARNKIRAWFKKEKRDENIVEGRAELEREFRRSNIPLTSELMDYMIESVGKRHNCSTEDDFYAAIGYGASSCGKCCPVSKKRPCACRRALLRTSHRSCPRPPRQSQTPGGQRRAGGGHGQLPHQVSRCCNPLPGDEIIGFITRGFGVSIHKRSCSNVPRDLTSVPSQSGGSTLTGPAM